MTKHSWGRIFLRIYPYKKISIYFDTWEYLYILDFTFLFDQGDV